MLAELGARAPSGACVSQPLMSTTTARYAALVGAKAPWVASKTCHKKFIFGRPKHSCYDWVRIDLEALFTVCESRSPLGRDPQHDPARTVEIEPDVIVDYGSEGKPVGHDLQHASTKPELIARLFS